MYLERHGCELMEAMNLQPVLADLHARCVDTGQQATKRLLCGILGDSSADPMRTAAREFNHIAEDYYRETLRRFHLTEAMAHLREDAAALERSPGNELRKHIRYGVRVQNLPRFLQSTEEKLLADDLVLPEIAALLNLLLVLMEHDSSQDTAAAE